jgi:FkbM family methyltransferase
MKTKHKIAIASAAYSVVRSIRALGRKGDIGIFHRNEAFYELDLKQGIDFSLYLIRSFEPATRRALRRLVRPGFNVIDVGANIGAHTLYLGRRVGALGKVVACEPTDFAFGKLERNISLNHDLAERITVLQCFLGSPERTQLPEQIYSGWPLTGGTDLHPEHLGTEQSTSRARSRTMDEVVQTCGLPRVDLVKMDVDGFECDVLSGAGVTLAKDAPIFVMEIAPYALQERGKSVNELLDYFSAHQYKFYDERDEASTPIDVRARAEKIRLGESINVIARKD